MSGKRKSTKAGVRIIKSQMDTYTDPVIAARDVKKSENPEQIDPSVNISASTWIPRPFDMVGLEMMIQHSTILPQCIRAYKNNIAGIGISVNYRDDI